MKVSHTRVDADGWCRLCLCEKVSSRPIFAKGAAYERLRSLILDCCPITLFDDDHLPSSICHRCENRLDITYQFRQLCRESERVLRARYESSFRQRGDILRVSGARADADIRNKVSEDPKNRCPRSPRTNHRNPGSSWSPSKNVEREIAKSDNGKDENVGEAGSEKRKEPSGYRTEERDEEEHATGRQRLGSESETRRSKQRRSEDEVTEPANETSLSSRDTAVANGTSASEKKYVCDECSKTFASKSGLRFHSKTHIGAKPHPCRHCGKRFAIPSYAKRHERIHTAEKQFICHVCSASFASSNGLRYHLRSHTGEANYRCETCGKSFCRYKYLKEHVFTHTGEKPFVCESCGVAYASSGSLFVHKKKCRRETSVREPGESFA